MYKENCYLWTYTCVPHLQKMWNFTILLATNLSNVFNVLQYLSCHQKNVPTKYHKWWTVITFITCKKTKRVLPEFMTTVSTERSTQMQAVIFCQMCHENFYLHVPSTQWHHQDWIWSYCILKLAATSTNPLIFPTVAPNMSTSPMDAHCPAHGQHCCQNWHHHPCKYKPTLSTLPLSVALTCIFPSLFPPTIFILNCTFGLSITTCTGSWFFSD